MEVTLHSSSGEIEVKERYIPPDGIAGTNYELFCLYLIQGKCRIKILFKDRGRLNQLVTAICKAEDRMIGAR